MKNNKFLLGRVVATRGVMSWIQSAGNHDIRNTRVTKCLTRHASGDWGDVDKEGAGANDRSIKGGRLVSEYTIDERRIWIITEADRSTTSILFPEEY